VVEENHNIIEFNVENHTGLLRNDIEKLSQVIINLVANAAKFTKKGKISVTFYDQKDKNGKQTVIEVKDTGVGIKHTHLARIFKEFEQVDQSMKKEYEGTGLGLAISKKFINLMAGDIEVESEPNVGSLFRITIPSKIKNPSTEKEVA
jgi:signal transduction histidine kinase